MPLLISDANIFIDLEEGGLIAELFQLPHEIMTPARQEQCPLLTGDNALRNAAASEGIEVRGTLWVVEALVAQGVITKRRAESAYNRMKSAGRRLPWRQAFERLTSL